MIARIFKQMAWGAAVALLSFGCGEESVGPPSTGSVSGKITFVGDQPDSGLVYINAAVNYPVMGPTDYYKELEVEPSQTEVTYTLEEMRFGTYAAIAVSWKDLTGRMGPAHTILGMYGCSEAEGDTVPDPVILSSEAPDVTGIDIVADYGRLSPPAASGTISGKVIFSGTWPSEGVFVAASLSWPMTGMPALSEPLSPDHLEYTIENLAFGEYKMVGVFTFPSMKMLGRWPDPVTISPAQPMVTGIDIVAKSE